MIGKLISWVFAPIVFALAFLVPLIAQSMNALDLSVSGIPNIVIALIIGGALGLLAQIRGSWIWIK